LPATLLPRGSTLQSTNDAAVCSRLRRRRFKELFGKRYGHQELDRRAVIGGRLGNIEVLQVPLAKEHGWED